MSFRVQWRYPPEQFWSGLLVIPACTGLHFFSMNIGKGGGNNPFKSSVINIKELLLIKECFTLLVFLSIDFFKYIPFRAFWLDETVWNISVISAGRGNTKTLVTNCPRCSGVEKLMLLIAKVWKPEQCYSYNCTAAYRTINYHGSDTRSQDFPRLAINLEVSKSLVQLTKYHQFLVAKGLCNWTWFSFLV